MTVTRTDRNQTFTGGVMTGEQVVIVDITVDAITFDLAAKTRTALTTNATFLALSAPTNADVLAQVKALTRENNALIRLLMGKVVGSPDLLTDNAGT